MKSRTVHFNLDGQWGLPGGSGGDTVHSLYNAVEGGVCPDGHVRPTEVVVDGAHQSHDVQVGAVAPLLLADATYKQATPQSGPQWHHTDKEIPYN